MSDFAAVALVRFTVADADVPRSFEIGFLGDAFAAVSAGAFFGATFFALDFLGAVLPAGAFFVAFFAFAGLADAFFFTGDRTPGAAFRADFVPDLVGVAFRVAAFFFFAIRLQA